MRVSSGSASLIGRTHEEYGTPNQDLVLSSDKDSVWMLLDGHGEDGEVLASTTANSLFEAILKCRSKTASETVCNWFNDINQEIVKRDKWQHSGTTLLALWQANPDFWLSYVGDTIAVEASLTSSNGISSRRLTQPHRVGLDSERKRVVSAGATIDGNYLIASDDLAISVTRSIGDADFPMVISDPGTEKLSISEDLLFYVFATDGIWEHISDQDMVERIALKLALETKSAENFVQTACREFIEDLENESIKKGFSLDDDASVLVILFRRPPSTKKTAVNEPN